MQHTTQVTTVAVLGLGPMGVAITRALSAAGHHVVGWNRTFRPLRDLGLADQARVELADSPEAAVAASQLVVVCVRDHTVSRGLVSRVAAGAEGVVTVNLTTGTPEEAAASAREAATAGLRYVTGAVMVPTSMVGTGHCLTLYAGQRADIDGAAPLLAAMGGTADVLGEDHALPPALDLAMLDLYFAGMHAFLHSAALAGANGIDPGRYLPYAESIVDTLRGTLPQLAGAIEQRTYDAGEARLDMCLAFLDKIVAASAEAGLDPGTAGVVRDASARAMTRWPGSTDWEVVAEDLRLVPASSAGPLTPARPDAAGADRSRSAAP